MRKMTVKSLTWKLQLCIKLIVTMKFSMYVSSVAEKRKGYKLGVYTRISC